MSHRMKQLEELRERKGEDSMNVVILLAVGLPLIWFIGEYYSRYISRSIGVDDSRVTPAVELQDGVDYVPSNGWVVFTHHFASIAGAGPILGPTIAMIYGWLPVWLWVIMGGLFFGAVHDYTGLFVSMREKGKSMAEVSHSSMGKAGFLLFIGFTIAMIVLVTSAFMGLTAQALTSVVPLTAMKVEASKTILQTVNINGVANARIGGIASTSVFVMTFFAPIVGYLLYVRKIKVLYGSILAFIVAILSIVTGIFYPVNFNTHTWMIILSIYTFIAAGIPVWIVLQPRDFTNSFVLFAGMAALIIGVIGAGFNGVQAVTPTANIAAGSVTNGLIWPFLFITVACGAISGFHVLVAGGTVSKQVTKESHARSIGYKGMILESTLSLLVIAAVSAGIDFKTYKDVVWPAVGAGNPILGFSLGMGGILHQGLGLPMSFGTVLGILMLEGFIVTTLDTAVRLNRFLFEELWSNLFKNPPAFIKSYYFNSGLSVLIMLYFAWNNGWKVIWPIFGSANQLLAALSLIVVSVWLASKSKKYWYAIIPAVFMMVTTLASLVILLKNTYIPKGNWPLAITDILLLILSVGVMIISIKKFTQLRSTKEITGK